MDFLKKLYNCKKFFIRYYCNTNSQTFRKLKKQHDFIDHGPKKISQHADEILTYYSKSEFFQNNFSHINWKFLNKQVNFPPSMIIADELVAKDIVSTIRMDITRSDVAVFEANPGLGLITRELLSIEEEKLPKICIFESDPHFKQYLKLLCKAHGERLKLYETNILKLWRMNFLDRIDKGGRMKGLMEDVQVRGWEETPCVKIIGTLPTSNFLDAVIVSIVFGHGITTYGRPELYVFLSPNLYANLKMPNRGMDVLFDIFFEWECLMEVDQRSFLPWIVLNPRTIKRLNKLGFDPTKFYLIKAVPKPDLDKIVSPEHKISLWYFTKTVIRGRRQRVMPCLEKWIPGCGPRLISKGLEVFTEFSDLSSDEVLQIFFEFISCPEFSSCPFNSSMEDYLMRSGELADVPGTDDRILSEQSAVLVVDEFPHEIIDQENT